MSSLPKYAQRADKRKLVKLLCKGRCQVSRWAEMNVNFPGNDVLRKSELGDFTATCLMCGREAKDSYNWYR